MGRKQGAEGSAAERKRFRKERSSDDSRVSLRIALSSGESLFGRTPDVSNLGGQFPESSPPLGARPDFDFSQNYRHTLRSLPFGLTIWWMEHPSEPLSFKLVFANLRAERALGVPVRDLLGRTMVDLLPDWFKTEIPDALCDVATEGISRNLGTFPYDKAGSGASVYSTTALPLPNHCVAIVHDDITEREKGEKFLKLVMQSLRAAADAPEPTTALAKSLETICILGRWQVGQAWILDAEHNALFCSPEAFYSEFQVREFRNVSLLTQVSKGDDLPGIVWARKAVVWAENLRDGVEMAPPRSVHARSVGLKSALAFPIISKGRLYGVIELLSLAARKTDPQMSNVTHEVGSQLGIILEHGELSARVFRVEDDERRKIARELHDSTAQTLSALALQLSVLEGDLGNSSQASKVLQTCQNLAKQACDEVQNFSHLLHPPALDEVGLCKAIHWYAREIRERIGLKLKLELPSHLPYIRPDAELALFRVFQESVSNVRRHSGSNEAVVRMSVESDSISLQIADGGKGMSPRLLTSSSDISRLGVGILGMQERLKQLNGELKITSGPAGTTVTARLPQTN